ncbi:hypothetical protein PCANC_05033 [Puccinia coronata f. sp. avenae]|uniref:Delta(14)-sterol reductase ERG24 n=1 Tax=Puccinia coronata f. sp. avenae TaxID=200324 RepID=A0A2N5T780_9BASI|nr:hypothetical protein PCANC_05033 [Puccinia coronata f. sp. avenae]
MTVHGETQKIQPEATPRPAILNPRTTEFEFGGRIGALGVTLSVPFFTYWLNLACSPQTGCLLGSQILDLRTLWNTSRFFSLEACYVYLGWYLYLVLCWLVLPGRWVDGTVLRDGTRLSYKINAFNTLMCTVLLTAVAFARWGDSPFLYIIDHYVELITASLIMSICQAVYCYWISFQSGRILALGGNSGNVIYDWFIGRDLNPRIAHFDIKTFNEMRPGLILWALLDFCWVLKQIHHSGSPSNSILLTFIFQFWYVFDAEYNEEIILTQMDITTDGFGFMLSVGDLTWVPFTYSLQLVYLSFVPLHLSNFQLALVLAVQLVGYAIFRISNEEKNAFRRKSENPKGLKFMETERGTRLLISGWWGLSRHPNYLGDWIMAWAWCLPTGVSTPITYFYAIYFAILLIHRQIRDEHACEKKYGKGDWNKYKKLVPWKIIPYIY